MDNLKQRAVNLRKFNLLLQKSGYSKEEAKEITQKAKKNILTVKRYPFESDSKCNITEDEAFSNLGEGQVAMTFLWSASPEDFSYWDSVDDDVIRCRRRNK